MFIDIAVILLLIVLNGVLAMTELAVVSARRGRLQALADKGSRGAACALALKRDPSTFLSTVQIGITLIGILSGTYSGVTIAEPTGDYLLARFPSLGTSADDIAIALVVTGVTYISLIIGELVPKQVALRHADTVATLIARPILLLSWLTRPLVWVLNISNRALLQLLGIRPGETPAASADDVKDIIAETSAAGAIDPEERQMLERVMRLDTIPVTATMTHRRDIVWFDVDDTLAEVCAKVDGTHHGRYPLCDGMVENIVGMIATKDLMLQLAREGKPDLRTIARKPSYLPEHLSVLAALAEFKQSTSNIAVIIDEHGGMQGIVTLKDLLETIVGTLPEPAVRGDEGAVQREDGSWLVDGGLSVHEAEEMVGLDGFASAGEYHTVAGFVLHHLRYIPQAGTVFEAKGWRFEVVDMDGMRIDKLLLTRRDAGSAS